MSLQTVHIVGEDVTYDNTPQKKLSQSLHT